MPAARLYRFRALDAEGATREGQLRAQDEPEALRMLMVQGLTPLAVEPAGGAAAAGPARTGRVKALERLTFTQELSTLLAAGVSLGEALPSLVEAYADQPLGAALAAIDRDVRGGRGLSEALAASAMGLPGYVLAMVEAGEASGELAAALRDAALQMEHERKIAQELRNALVYPVVLVVAGLAAVLIIFIGVVPRFAGLLNSSRASVPEVSRWIIEAGIFAQQHLLELSLAAALALGLVAAAASNPGLRMRALDVVSRMPLLGHWLVRVDVGRWAGVLGSLLANRVPFVTAVGLSQGALRLPRLRQDLLDTAPQLQRGKALSEVLALKAWFPAARLNLVRVGERSGELPRMLRTLGALETDEARALQKRVLTLIEPAAILLIGAVIGFIMVAVMMAITSLNTVNF